MKWLVILLLLLMATAFLASYAFGLPLLSFGTSALALIILSKFLGDATEQLSHHVGQGVAGLLNVTFSNLAELIIVFAAIRANLIELVQAGIVGSMIGNLLLVMGCSVYFGCRKHGTLSFNQHTSTLFINQFFLVAVVLMLPSLFNSRIPEYRHLTLSYLLAMILFGTYIYFYRLSLTDKRFQQIDDHLSRIEHRWSKSFSIIILVLTAIGAFFMSELLVGEVEPVALTLGLSQSFIGFIVLPLLGNIAEHAVAVFAARKKMTELSLAIAVGSASQVGMVVAPAAVLFGFLLGNPFTFDFTGLPLSLLVVSLIAAYIVMRDNQWNINEGIMLLALYATMVISFGFTQ